MAKLGQPLISSLSTDTVPGAVYCNEQYSKLRDEVLSQAHWKFARKRASLAQTTAPTFGYTYAYQLPADFLKVISLDYPDIEYQIEDQTLVTDEDTINLIYLAQVTNTSKFTAHFAETVSARIAAELAYALTGSATVQQNMWSLYRQQLAEARSMNSQQGTAQDLSADDWFNSRF
jgi:hypothetical protein